MAETVFTDVSGFQSLNANIHWLCCTHSGKTKRKKKKNVPLSALPPPTLRFRTQSFQVYWVPKQPLKRAVHPSAVPPEADMDPFGFAFQLSGSIFGPLIKFLGQHFLPADLG